jgi:hypothetical protein
MLPQENFVIYTPGDCFWWLLRPVLTRLLINSSDSKIQKFTPRFYAPVKIMPHYPLYGHRWGKTGDYWGN